MGAGCLEPAPGAALPSCCFKLLLWLSPTDLFVFCAFALVSRNKLCTEDTHVLCLVWRKLLVRSYSLLSRDICRALALGRSNYLGPSVAPLRALCCSSLCVSYSLWDNEWGKSFGMYRNLVLPDLQHQMAKMTSDRLWGLQQRRGLFALTHPPNVSLWFSVLLFLKKLSETTSILNYGIFGALSLSSWSSITHSWL